MKYPVLCAWCNKRIGESEVANSHGICEACKKKQLEELERITEDEDNQ